MKNKLSGKEREMGESGALVGQKSKFLTSKRNGHVVQHLRKAVVKTAYMTGALGGDVVDLAKRLGVKRSTLVKWMDGDGEIEAQFLRGLDTMRLQIETVAYKKARGYEANRVATCIQTDKNGKVVMKTKTRTKEHIQPDGGMIKWLLRHRAGDRYPESGEGGGVKVVINMDGDDKDI